jgi:hypothetical protein
VFAVLKNYSNVAAGGGGNVGGNVGVGGGSNVGGGGGQMNNQGNQVGNYYNNAPGNFNNSNSNSNRIMVYSCDHDTEGSITLTMAHGKKLDHMGIQVKFFGRIDMVS